MSDPFKEGEELGELAARVARVVMPGLEEQGIRFALFLYTEPLSGPVVQVSRDREQTAIAVSRWLLEHLERQKARAQG